MTCSTLRMPAPVARQTSATVWSRCRSTKCSSQSPGSPLEAGHQPQRAHLAEAGCAVATDGSGRVPGVEPRGLRGCDARGRPVGQAAVEVEGAAGRSDDLLSAHGAVGHEGRQVVVPAQPALALAVQVHHRAPAAGDREQVAVELLERAGEQAVGVEGARRCTPDSRASPSVSTTALPGSTCTPAATSSLRAARELGRASTTAATSMPAASRSATVS